MWEQITEENVIILKRKSLLKLQMVQQHLEAT